MISSAQKPRVFYSNVFLAHGPAGHVECKERLERTMARLRSRADMLEFAEPRRASAADIETVHEPRYVQHILGHGEGPLDPDTYMSDGSAAAALTAAGAAVECVDGAIAGRRLSVGLVRPPGHHALPARAMGFCIFNNAAIGAKRALLHVKKVLIVDWDVHHGNGTELMFYESPDVLYFSTHRRPHFPGTGGAADTGAGEGEGFNVNVPLPAGSTDADYADAFERILLPVMDAYAPELVIVSAGYDPHRSDPLGGMAMTDAGFHRLASLVKEGAGNAGIVVLLEGGYSLGHLPLSIEASLLGFMGEPCGEATATERTPAAAGHIARAAGIQKKYWRL